MLRLILCICLISHTAWAVDKDVFQSADQFIQSFPESGKQLNYEFNSPEGLKHRMEYLEAILLNIDGNKTQKEFFHTVKKTGDCKTTTKTKKF